MANRNGIIDFLSTKRNIADLNTALEIVREFKQCESEEEWVECPFQAWIKLEQLEEFLAYLTGTGALQDDSRRIAAECGITPK